MQKFLIFFTYFGLVCSTRTGISFTNVTEINGLPNLVNLAKQLNLTELLTRWSSVGLDHILNHEGLFTVFAPTNEAFANRPGFCDNVPLKDLLNYHIGKGLFIASAFKNELLIPSRLKKRDLRINIYHQDDQSKYDKITTVSGRAMIKPDNQAFNGIIHILDEVICSVYEGSAAFEIDRCPAFSIFIQAINATELYDFFDSQSPVTVFAPEDSAFKKLPADIFEQLMGNKTALKQAILYHSVVGKSWYTAGLNANMSLPTEEGKELEISYDGDNIFVNGATITLPNAAVRNGVIHSINEVLLPWQN